MSERFGSAALALSGLAARLLGWRPGEFWAATPAELSAALALPEGAAPLDRAEFNHLMDSEHA